MKKCQQTITYERLLRSYYWLRNSTQAARFGVALENGTV